METRKKKKKGAVLNTGLLEVSLLADRAPGTFGIVAESKRYNIEVRIQLACVRECSYQHKTALGESLAPRDYSSLASYTLC